MDQNHRLDVRMGIRNRMILYCCVIGAILCVFVILTNFGQSFVGTTPNQGLAPADCRNSNGKLPKDPQLTDCCPLLQGPDTQIINFKFPDPKEGLRIRMPAHKLSAEYLKKYNEAYKLMKELPEEDPRNFINQAKVHCAYCSNFYNQPGKPNVPFAIHRNWRFLPWHRLYLYFHERILGELIGDPTFALPFWEYDNQGAEMPWANVFPSDYLKGSLINRRRNDEHVRGDVVVDLAYDVYANKSDFGVPDDERRKDNNAVMYQHVVSGAKTAALFLGRRPGSASSGAGSIELTPHNTVHTWTGSPKNSPHNPNGEDMGSFYTAALDPIFFAHHANIDRLWTVWNNVLGRSNFPDQAWLQTRFLFYDEKQNLVTASVADCLDTLKLNYQYQQVENSWIVHKPVASLRSGLLTMSKITESGDKIDKTFSHPFSVVVSVKASKQMKNKDKEAVLTVEGIQVDANKGNRFDVFINLPEANKDTPMYVVEYAGSFVHIPHFNGINKSVTNFFIGIGDKLVNYGEDDIIVTLVPTSKDESPIYVQKISALYE